MKANVLVYVSSAQAVPLCEGGKQPVGVFLGEVTETLEPLLGAGYSLFFVSPDGKEPHIDRQSYRLRYWGFSKKRLKNALAFYEKLKDLGIERPMKLKDLLAAEGGLKRYDALFVPGGHAPMTDILFKNWLEGEELNEETGILLSHFHKEQKPTALICHAPSVLAAAPDVNGEWIYKDYKMTCITMVSEHLVEDVPGLKTMRGHMPDYPEQILKRKGAKLKQVYIPLISNVVEDRELITGQDPYAARELGQKLKRKIEKYLESRAKIR
ncbi:MAG: DJ-1/PfpI family protein [Patescibacteria group bacterium]